MDKSIFTSGIRSDSSYAAFKKQTSSNDLLGSFLIFHMCCENFVELFIYNVCNQKDFFYDDKGKKILVTFADKLRIASKLGLPEPIYKAISKINKQRNDYAHNVADVTLDDAFLQSVASHLDSYPAHQDGGGLLSSNIRVTGSSDSISFADANDKIKLLTISAFISTKMEHALESL